MAAIQLFLQLEGVHEIRLVEVSPDGVVGDIIAGLPDDFRAHVRETELMVFLEDGHEAIALDLSLEAAGIRHQHSVHVHRCRHITVTVHFGADSKEHQFSPSTTIRHVKRWAVGDKGFKLSPVDAAEHVLQLQGTGDRPDEDVHIGTLTHAPHCSVVFDLVPKVRVEG